MCPGGEKIRIAVDVGDGTNGVAQMSAPHGVFAILGNHDDDHDMPAALIKNGVEVLKDARTRVTIRNEKLDLVGIRFWTKRQMDIAPLVRDSVPATLFLAHDPRRLTEAAALDIPVVLSGHTHGGQVVLPLIGAVAAQKFPVVSGIGVRGATTMFVSRGIGTIYVPVRFNCPPEVAILTLSNASY
jgi:predicted MPP superfamily phosphohydrolase